MNKIHPALQAALLAFGIAGVFYWAQSGMRLDFSDEGFLWYGALHTRLGEFPLRDFQSYDPGRYYWCAALSFLFGMGLSGLRLAVSVFQGLCLWLGFLAMHRSIKQSVFLALVGILSALWMLYYFQYFDAGIVLAAVFFAVRLAEDFSLARCFQAGLACAFAIWIGINHGLYVTLAFTFLLFFCFWKQAVREPRKAIGFFVLGILTGLLPLVVFCLSVSGFFESYRNWIFYCLGRLAHGMKDIAVRKSTDPVFWDQRVMFATVLLSYLFLLREVLRLKKEALHENAALVGSFFVGAAYLHQIYSRKEMIHLGQAIFPLFAALFVLATSSSSVARRHFAWFLIAALSVLTLQIALPATNLGFWWRVPKSELVSYSVGQDRIWISSANAKILDTVKRLVNENVPQDRTLLIAPLLTTFYPFLEKPSPVWEIYFNFYQPEAVQRKMIAQLEEKRVDWVLLGPLNALGREEAFFTNTHAALWDYLKTNFEPLPDSGLPPGYFFLKRIKVSP